MSQLIAEAMDAVRERLQEIGRRDLNELYVFKIVIRERGQRVRREIEFVPQREKNIFVPLRVEFSSPRGLIRLALARFQVEERAGFGNGDSFASGLCGGPRPCPPDAQ